MTGMLRQMTGMLIQTFRQAVLLMVALTFYVKERQLIFSNLSKVQLCITEAIYGIVLAPYKQDHNCELSCVQ